jgi:signal transduction histidine kinase
MSEEQLKNVFAPFFTTKPNGTGLGLALVQQITIEHGGHVECQSTLGKGSTFTIFLPVDKN